MTIRKDPKGSSDPGSAFFPFDDEPYVRELTIPPNNVESKNVEAKNVENKNVENKNVER